MSSTSPIVLSFCSAAVAATVLAAWPASAQDDIVPGRGADISLEARPRAATSDLAATTPVATPAQQRQARTLSMAIFAKPGAAAKAAAKVDAANQPDLAAVKPKAEWTDDRGVALGGKGVEFKAPF
jgi:hypothetical protein